MAVLLVAELSKAELLNYAVENGIVDINTITKQIEMNERKKYLEMHKYEIWQGEKDKKWYTYFPDDTKGRRLIKRASKESVESAIISYYKQHENELTIKQVFELWSEEKLEYKEIEKQSYDRYYTDFTRFFVNNKAFPNFSDKKIRFIDDEILEKFIKKTIVEMNLTEKAYGGMRILINGIFKYAKNHRYSQLSITNFMGDLNIPKRMFKQKVRDKKNGIYQEEEADRLVDYLKSQTQDLKALGILLTFETGVRVGELSSLKLEDFRKNSIHVQRTEIKYRNEDGKWTFSVQDFPKSNAGNRYIMINSNAVNTIHNINKARSDGEFLFSENGNRIKSSCFRRKLEVICKKLGIDYKSNHKIRATYGTMLIDGRVDDSIVAEQMGHVDIETTRKYYYYSNKDEEKRMEQVKSAVYY
ncbi:site-specific integrase [Faecalicatena acetigenes]|uniref:Site-specific integrase n=1 Tax=Faecalicatena acetigenes TaxID=2981790 RepID=A0ABT2TDS7_9FIRM|nr:site-specific integrase [Faecalicatena acetigenes]MCU6748429.1 site-specific integrase [Faecalicatena acetigenes]